jgi:N-acetylneuraminic acid mutarotase
LDHILHLPSTEASHLFIFKMSTATATLRKLSIKVLKARAATHGVTAPAGHKGKKDTWIAAIQQAEGLLGGSGGFLQDVEAEWELLEGGMEGRRSRHTAAVHGGMICAVGGQNTPDAVEVYDTATKVWSELAGGAMPRKRLYSASAMYKGKLYVVGGFDAAERALRSVEVYDFATQQWSPLPTEMATARREHGCVVCENKLYVVGGKDAEDNKLGSVEVYDFATETWSILPAPILAESHSKISNTVVEHKGKVYVVGGDPRERLTFPHFSNLQRVAVYDIAAEAWSLLPAEMPCTRLNFAAAVHGNKIYVVGGDDGWESMSSVMVYDIDGGDWSLMPVEMTSERGCLAVSVLGDNLYAIGGLDTDEQTMEVLALPSPLPWTPTQHSTFPNSFKRTVYTLMCCFARTNSLPEDALFAIIWLSGRFAFEPTGATRVSHKND